MIAGCRSAAIKAEKPDLRLCHRVAAALATHDLSRLVVIDPIVVELFPTLRADKSVVRFERGLYCLIAAAVVMNERLLREMTRMAFHADFACMKARRIAILADVQAFKKPATQNTCFGQLL
jgi:hypothetical protein